MRILFVIHDLGFADHIAIAHLSSIAKQLNHETFFWLLDKDGFFAKAKVIRPDVVAYSVNVIGYQRIVEVNDILAQLIKFTSIMGGPQATFSPETFSGSGMDAYCVGEGEYAFRDFLIKVEQGDSFDDVKNLITKNKTNPVRPLIGNLDELPLADRDLVISNSFLRGTAKKTFYVSRGCPFSCAYCCNNYYHQLYRGKGPVVRRFSVNRVIEEIERVGAKYRMDFVKFGDDCFALKADSWFEEFAEEYSKRIGLPFNCYMRIDTIDDSILKLLKKAGCFSVHLSVDSTSLYVRNEILQRQMKSKDIARRLRRIREFGINTWVNYMLAAPKSSLQDDLDTIKMSKKGKVTYAAYSTTVPMKKTKLYDYCVQEGFLDPSSYQGDMSGCSEKSALSCFTEKEKKVRHNIYLLGALIAKLPYPLDKIALLLIRIIPPNKLFREINGRMYSYYIRNKIFALPEDHHKVLRYFRP